MNNNGYKRILLVEDEAIIAAAQSMQLKTNGYKVITANSGAKAIEKLNDKENKIDLILMDIDLGSGKMDGIETAELILKEDNTPILFLSNHTEPEIMSKAEKVSSYGYVVKNSGFPILNASIKMALKLDKAYQDLNTRNIEVEAGAKELSYFEKRYRRLFETAKDGILILDADSGKIVDVNPFLIEMLGYSKEEFLNKSIWDISAFKNIFYSKQLFEELKKKSYVRYNDLPLETQTGSKVYVEVVSNVYYVGDEKVIQCNIRDMTVQTEYTKSLASSIVNKNILLNEFQHRAKNSFQLIMSLINLRACATNGEAKNNLDELNLKIGSISDLYSLLYETKTFYEVQLNAYCDKIVESMSNLNSNITIHKNFEMIKINSKIAATVGMVLVELLSNAVKYAFPELRKGIINVGLKQLDSKIILIVEDDGVGFPKDWNRDEVKTMGFDIIDAMVDQLNGNIKYIQTNGTNVIIEFPCIMEIKG